LIGRWEGRSNEGINIRAWSWGDMEVGGAIGVIDGSITLINPGEFREVREVDSGKWCKRCIFFAIIDKYDITISRKEGISFSASGWSRMPGSYEIIHTVI
jgi:hypothetical protein